MRAALQTRGGEMHPSQGLTMLRARSLPFPAEAMHLLPIPWPLLLQHWQERLLSDGDTDSVCEMSPILQSATEQLSETSDSFARP